MQHLAHRSTDGREQTLASHLLGVSLLAERHASSLQLASAGASIGLLHDLGKATEEFQKYLNSFKPDSGVEPQDELRGKIDHSTAGAQVVARELAARAIPLASELALLLVVPLVSHHSGLLNCVSAEGHDTLDQRLKKSVSKTRVDEAWQSLPLEVRSRAETLLSAPELLQGLRRRVGRLFNGAGAGGPEAEDRKHLAVGLLVRMLFSCLIDADRTDTANFEHPVAARLRQDGAFAAWDLLSTRLDAALRQMPSEGQINRIRRDISDACLRAAERPCGTYLLTVPTGGGKTLAALRFALQHAQLHSLEHIIFVSPYISIVDQNAAVARTILEPKGVTPGTIVLEHHSNLPLEPDAKAGRERWRQKVLAENWDAPVVYTTMVQVLEALFGGGTRSVRRLHALARSVVIFDEAQTVPLTMLHLFNNAVNFLTGECGSTVVLCTATQPELHTVDQARGAVALSPNPELMEDVPALFLGLRRYTVQDESMRPGGWTQEQVAGAVCNFAAAQGSCLAVVNTKRDACEVFQRCRRQLPDAYVVHLSTAMCPEHRTRVLAELRQRLHVQREKAGVGPPIVCVSTQLIEAGVDIDFATVIRDLAGLDSIAQAAGRCNRNGTRAAGGSVLIVRLPDPPARLKDILIARRCATRVLEEWRRSSPGLPFPLDDPLQMKTYFAYLLFERAKDMSYNVTADMAARDNTLLSMLGAFLGAQPRAPKVYPAPVQFAQYHRACSK